MRKSLIFAGSLAQKPRHGGHTSVFLQYLLGLRRLGWDVVFADVLPQSACVDESGRQCPLESSVGAKFLDNLFEAIGMPGAYILLGSDGESTGIARADIIARARESAGLINVMGFLGDSEILDAVSNKIFLDIDPGFGQMWCELGQHDPFDGHDQFVTIATNIGSPECSIPTCGRQWIATLQPVVLDQWPLAAGRGAGYTSVASWRGAYGPVEYKGDIYGLRVHEFRKFMRLPVLAPGEYRIALDIHPEDRRDIDALSEFGWQIENPDAVAGDVSAYRSYIQSSHAEFMVAKNMYVRTRGGWFSDRSACYLASGRPVIAQKTGFEDLLPVGEGLLAFETVDEAASAVRALDRDYERHAAAARRLAEEWFDSDRVLTRLLRNLQLES